MARSESVAVLIGAPPVVAAVVGLTLALFGLVGVHPFWPPTPLTLPEAVALRSGWDVMRQLRAGVDPNTPFPVRQRILHLGRPEISAWEAAVAAGRPEVIELLAREGATLSPDAGRAAVCLGRALQRTEALDALARHYHVDVAQSCDANH